MKKQGLTNSAIAKRLNCSKKTVSRTCRDANISLRGKTDNITENFKRNLYKKFGESGDKIGYRFGVTRQAILK